jgi:hypothetical protein
MPRSQSRFKLIGGLALLFAGLAIASSAGGAAMAASDTGNTTANVTVASTITLSSLTGSFTISGNPGATSTKTSAVSMNVLTNNLTGYQVTVKAASTTLTGSTGNTDTLPVTDLKVRESGGVTYAPLNAVTSAIVHSQLTRSGSSGDTITNDYQVDIPFVNADTYSVTLNYVASTI